MCFFVSFQKWTVIVDTAGHINYSNDKCPWWTVIVEKSTIVVQWTVIVAAATISVHGGQLSLMDNYRCYSWRPRKTDASAERRLIRIVKINPRKTLQDVSSVFNSQTPTKISKTTVKRRLQLHGYKRRVVKKKIVISKQHMVRRRAWCRTKLHMNVENYWRKVIFTDETQVV